MLDAAVVLDQARIIHWQAAAGFGLDDRLELGLVDHAVGAGVFGKNACATKTFGLSGAPAGYGLVCVELEFVKLGLQLNRA